MAQPASAAKDAAKAHPDAASKEVCVVSYRSHHHAFDPKDPNVTFVEYAKPLTAPRRLLQFIFTWTMVHYFAWIVPMIAFLWLLYAVGLWYVSAVLLAVYIRSFLDGAQYKNGRPWDSLRTSSMWRLTNRYNGVEVVRTQKLDPAKQYMFGLYPHGILILSRTALYGGIWERLFPGIENRVLGASPMFWAPGCRELCLWLGAVNAAKRVAVNLFKKYKLNLMVYPGGSDEIFETDPASTVTTLVVRKGFIKLAVQNGAEIVPAFVFGEKWLYHVQPISESVKRWFMKKLKMPMIIFYGRYFSWMPLHDEKRAFLSVVFGKPIPVQQQAEPSDEYIDQLWEEYQKQIQDIFVTYKGKFGYAEEETLVLKQARSSSKGGKDKAPATSTNGDKKNGKAE